MGTWKQSVFFGMVAIIALGFCFIGCDNGETGTKEFTVTFDLERGNIGGNTANVEITVKSGEKIANLPDPKKADNTFGGWFTEKNGNGNTFTENTSVSASITVFAKWIPDPVEQYYDIPEVKNSNNVIVKVRVIYTALPDTVPDYITGVLSEVVKEAHSYQPLANDLAINVITTGLDCFVKTDIGKLSVRESWISDPDIDLNDKMGNLFSALGSVHSI
jgi:hypothetical protein